jgi:hypothetical protein
MHSEERTRKILGLLFVVLVSTVNSCSVSSPPPPSTSTPTDFSNQPILDKSESYNGTGSTDISFPVSYLPAMFSLYTMGGTNSVIKTSANRDFESIVVLKTQSVRENDVGISDLEIDGDRITVSIKAIDEWWLSVLPLSEANFLAVPGKVNGNGEFLFILEGAQPRYIHLTTERENQAITLMTFDGQDGESLFSTTRAYDDWIPVPSNIGILQIVGVGSWAIEVVQSADIID